MDGGSKLSGRSFWKALLCNGGENGRLSSNLEEAVGRDIIGGQEEGDGGL